MFSVQLPERKFPCKPNRSVKWKNGKVRMTFIIDKRNKKTRKPALYNNGGVSYHTVNEIKNDVSLIYKTVSLVLIIYKKKSFV